MTTFLITVLVSIPFVVAFLFWFILSDIEIYSIHAMPDGWDFHEKKENEIQ